jgi:hypothetical protein
MRKLSIRICLPYRSACCALFCLYGLGSQQAIAQGEYPAFQLGFKGGVPLRETFDTRSGLTSAFGSATRRYIIGATGEFKLPGRLSFLSFEVDALYKRVGFDYNALTLNALGPVAQSTVANWWEFPGLFKYKFSAGRFHPFIDFGASLRHISSIRQTTYSPAFLITDNSAFIQNRNAPGGVFGIGAAFVMKNVRISPEVRYTHWFNQVFGNPGNTMLGTNLDQLDFLAGFTFRVHKQ